MISVIISNDSIVDNSIEIIDKNDINHLKNSFRVKLGERIRVVDGDFEYICEIILLEKKRIVLNILEKRKDSFSNSIKIDAAISILKNDKMDLTVQKLTEIGINCLIPILTKRGVVKLTEKKERWNAIIKEATKQCQAVKFMDIVNPVKISELSLNKYDLVLVCYEDEKKRTIKNILQKLDKKIDSILYIIGPEGGFEKSEIEFLEKNGAIPISLGKRILRAETASIVMGGVLVNEF